MVAISMGNAYRRHRFYVALGWALTLVPVALVVVVIVDIIIGFPIMNFVINSANDNPVIARLILVSVIVLLFAMVLSGPVFINLSHRIQDLEAEMEVEAARGEEVKRRRYIPKTEDDELRMNLLRDAIQHIGALRKEREAALTQVAGAQEEIRRKQAEVDELKWQVNKLEDLISIAYVELGFVAPIADRAIGDTRYLDRLAKIEEQMRELGLLPAQKQE